MQLIPVDDDAEDYHYFNHDRFINWMHGPVNRKRLDLRLKNANEDDQKSNVRLLYNCCTDFLSTRSLVKREGVTRRLFSITCDLMTY